MPEIGNTSVFSQTDASNGTGTMPSWLGSAAPSTLDDAGRALQGAVTREWNWRNVTLTTGGTTTAYTLTYSVAPAAYYNGQRFAFIVNAANTAAATLNVNALGAKNLRKMVNGTATALNAGDLAAGAYVEVAYNTSGDYFVILNRDLSMLVPDSNAGGFLRNRLINGAMEIWQRGFPFGSVGGYTADRFYCNRNGGVAGVTFTKAYAAFSTKKDWMSIQRDSGNTSTASAAVYQAIEGVNCRDLAGGNVTLSMLMGTGGTLSSTTNNMTLQVYYQTTTTDIGPTGSWTVIAGTSFSVASNVGPTKYSATFAIPSTATQLLLVISFAFTGTASTDDRYYITEVQLEAGSVATPFERRQYGQELALCQRYCEVLASSSIQGIVGSFATTAYIPAYYSYKATKRAIPTVGSITWATTNCNTPALQSNTIDVLVYAATALSAANSGYNNSASFIVSAEL